MELVGRKVFHKEYGIGTIIEYDSKRIIKHIMVDFKDRTLSFLYPSCMLFSLSWYNEDYNDSNEDKQSLSCKDNPSIPHSAITYKENVVFATCQKEGSYDEVIRCSVCDKEISRCKVPIEKQPHTIGEPTSENLILPTCISKGRCDKVVYCEKCEEVISQVTIQIPPTEHTIYKISIEFNKKAYHCSACKQIIYRPINKAESQCEHLEELRTKYLMVPTSADNGSCEIVGKCVNCSEELRRDIIDIPKFGRDSELITNKSDSYVNCVVSGHTVLVRKEIINPATCVTNGFCNEIEYCVKCGKELNIRKCSIPKLEHIIEICRENETPATCHSGGRYEEVERCTRCNKVIRRKIVVIPLAEKTIEIRRENEVPATCESEGHYDEVEYCLKCNEEIKRKTIITEKLGHIIEILRVNEIPATCTDEGSYDEIEYCTRCNKEISRRKVTIPLLDHSVAFRRENEVPATYDKKGGYDKIYYCSVCGKDIKTEHIEYPVLQHQHIVKIRYENVEKSTCCKAGSYDEVSYCSVCNTEISRVQRNTKKLKHTRKYQSYIIKEASCTEEGITEITCYCSVCLADLFSWQTYRKLKHSFGKPFVDDEADPLVWIDKEKHLVKRCKMCGGYLFPDQIDKKDPQLFYESIAHVPFYNTHGAVSEKWTESYWDDEQSREKTYEQSSEIEKIMIESNLYEGLDKEIVISMPIYYKMLQLGFDYGYDSRSFVFVGLNNSLACNFRETDENNRIFFSQPIICSTKITDLSEEQYCILETVMTQKKGLSFSKLIQILINKGFSTDEAVYAAKNCKADWREQAEIRAKDLLLESAYSRISLLEQLEYEGFSPLNATYCINMCGIDWKHQAARKALALLSDSYYSRIGLINQLRYEGFLKTEAIYGADKISTDWNLQAENKAIQYLNSNGFSYKQLVDQLGDDGFTDDEINYAVDKCNADWNQQAVKSAKYYLDHYYMNYKQLIFKLLHDGFTEEQVIYTLNDESIIFD